MRVLAYLSLAFSIALISAGCANEGHQQLLSVEGLQVYTREEVAQARRDVDRSEQGLQSIGLRFKVDRVARSGLNWDTEYLNQRTLMQPLITDCDQWKGLLQFWARAGNYFENFSGPYLLKDANGAAHVTSAPAAEIELIGKKLSLTADKLNTDLHVDESCK